MEASRYHREKHTDDWKRVRAGYLDILRKRIDSDPEFAEKFRARSRRLTAMWKARWDSDPVRREALLKAKRAQSTRQREMMRADPAAWEAHKAKARAWYHSLSDVEVERIFYAPRRARAAKRQLQS